MSEVQDRAQSSFNLNPQDELNDLRMSAKALPLLEHVRRFIRETVNPMSAEYRRLGEGKADPWSFAPGQLEVLEKAKDKAKAEGLWNFFLPHAETGEGLSNLDYAPISPSSWARTPMYLGDHELRRPGHRQHGGAGARRDAGAEEAVAGTAAGRHDPLGLRHDRGERRLVGRLEGQHPAQPWLATST